MYCVQDKKKIILEVLDFMILMCFECFQIVEIDSDKCFINFYHVEVGLATFW